MSPLSSFYESTIVYVRVSFVFSDFDCPPSEVTNTLGIDPDEVIVKGEKRRLRNGKEIINVRNTWTIESTSGSKDVNEHIRQLLDRLASVYGKIPSEWSPYFDVQWKGNYLYAGSGPFYEADVLVGIAKLGADLFQDIYQVDDEES